MRTDLTHDLDGVFATRNQRLGDVAQVRSGNLPTQVTPHLGNVRMRTGLFGIDFANPAVLLGLGVAAGVAVYFLRKRKA